MPNISSKEVDVDMSELDSDSSGDYGGGQDLEEESYCLGSSKTSSVDDNPEPSSQSFYKQDRSILSKNVDLDFFDPNEMPKKLKDVGFTGDQNESDDSSRTCVESPIAFGQALKLRKLRRDINGRSKLGGRDLKLFNKTFFKSVSSSLEGSDILPSTKTVPSKKSASRGRSHIKDHADMESITLFIKVPRGKLLSHIKEKSRLESKKSRTFKTPSSFNASDSSNSQLNSNTIRLNDESIVSTNHNKDKDINSISDITSYMDKSKQFIKNFRDSMKVTDRKLQTNDIYYKTISEKSEKETQTLINFSYKHSSEHPNENYFLCNICRKIVPADLSPICMKLKCSALTKCDLIFHSELDMVMHLPVKHTFEFDSYKICMKCNLMYPPSNTVSIKGCCTCLDCLANLVQIANG